MWAVQFIVSAKSAPSAEQFSRNLGNSLDVAYLHGILDVRFLVHFCPSLSGPLLGSPNVNVPKTSPSLNANR